METKDSVMLLDRASGIIELIYSSEKPIGVSEIAGKVGISKATAFRILNSLVANRYLEKVEDEKYSLGLLFIKYGEKVKSDSSIKSIAEPYLKEISAIVGETVNLSIRYGDYAITLHSISGEASILVSKLSPISPLYCSAMGKIFLAYSNTEDLKKYYIGGLEKLTVNTITTFEDFKEEQRRILSEGISQDLEECEYGLFCVAAPILNALGDVAAAISVSGPATRLLMKGMENIKETLKVTSGKISNKMQENNIINL